MEVGELELNCRLEGNPTTAVLVSIPPVRLLWNVNLEVVFPMRYVYVHLEQSLHQIGYVVYLNDGKHVKVVCLRFRSVEQLNQWAVHPFSEISPVLLGVKPSESAVLLPMSIFIRRQIWTFSKPSWCILFLKRLNGNGCDLGVSGFLLKFHHVIHRPKHAVGEDSEG